jgi:hypothetical protein
MIGAHPVPGLQPGGAVGGFLPGAMCTDRRHPLQVFGDMVYTFITFN